MTSIPSATPRPGCGPRPTTVRGCRSPSCTAGTSQLPAPCLLYGYGAYENSIDPAFSHHRLSLLDRGVVFAVAHVRGGGEMGRAWYESGRMEHKANTFGDFIACARHLVDRRHRPADALAGRGGSAGGLLIGAVANMAPELFRPWSPRFPSSTASPPCSTTSCPLTVGEWEEWGNPAGRRGGLPPDALLLALRQVVEAAGHAHYPELLVTAGLNDPRVGYWEPAKWVAKLRALSPATRVLLRTELGAGHGGPSGRYDAWKEEALVLAFLLDALGLDLRPAKPVGPARTKLRVNGVWKPAGRTTWPFRPPMAANAPWAPRRGA